MTPRHSATPAPAAEAAAAARRDPIPPWVSYSGVIIVGGVALAVLAYYQHRFGQDQAKMSWLLSWSFSVGLDWGGVVAGIFWFLGTGKLSTWGRWAAISLVSGSTVLTCISFGLIAGWTFAPLGAIHSLVAFLMAKLLTLWQADRAHRRGQVDAIEHYRITAEQQLAEQHAAAAHEIAEQRARLVEELDARRAELAQLREEVELGGARVAAAVMVTADLATRAAVVSSRRRTPARRPAAPARRRAPDRPVQLQSTDQLHRRAVEYLRANRKPDGTYPGRYVLAGHLGLNKNSHQAKTVHATATAELDLERTGTD